MKQQVKFTTGPYEIPLEESILFKDSSFIPRVGEEILVSTSIVHKAFFKVFNEKIKDSKRRTCRIMKTLKEMSDYFMDNDEFINIIKSSEFKSEAELITKAEQLAVGYITDILLEVKEVTWNTEKNLINIRLSF